MAKVIRSFLPSQDLYLTGSPDITYWKAVWKRYSNFATEQIEQVFNGSVRKGARVSCTISRNGDMVNQCWLEITCTQTGPTWYPAEALIKEVEFELGGQKCDRHYSDFFRVYSELFHTGEQKEAYKRLTNFSWTTETTASQVRRKLYLPLNFFFNKEAANALPLVSLQFHEAKLHFTFADAPTEFNIADDFEAKLYAEFCYLDVEERKRYATGSHEMLVEQLQFTGDEALPASQGSIRLNFNHPVKYLAWVVRPPAAKYHGLYNLSVPTALHIPTGSASTVKANNEGLDDLYNDVFAPIKSAKLMLNGHDRASARSGSYYSEVVPMQCCGTKPQAGVYMYSFALRPRDTQPSGTCNFSRIDNASLHLEVKSNGAVTEADLVANGETTHANAQGMTTGTTPALGSRVVKVFAQSYNVLRILSGMGGLAFSS